MKIWLVFQHYQTEVERHQATKENLDRIASQLKEATRGNAEDLIESQSRLDDNWSELCALLEDRENELLGAQTDLLLVRCLDDVEQLEAWFNGARDTMEKPILVLSSASLEDTKEQLGQYRVGYNVSHQTQWSVWNCCMEFENCFPC